MKKVIGLFLIVSSMAGAAFASSVCGIVGNVSGQRVMLENDGTQLNLEASDDDVGNQIDRLNGDEACAQGDLNGQSFSVRSIKLKKVLHGS